MRGYYAHSLPPPRTGPLVVVGFVPAAVDRGAITPSSGDGAPPVPPRAPRRRGGGGGSHPTIRGVAVSAAESLGGAILAGVAIAAIARARRAWK